MAASSPEQQIFFVYDHTALQKEEDDIKDAIVYFFPTSTDIQRQCSYCGQLMGLVAFFDNFVGSPPTIYTLANNKFAIKHLGKFSLALAGSHTDPNNVILNQLEYLHRLVTFYQHSISSIEEMQDDSTSFLDRMAAMWDCFWPFVRRYGDDMAAAFEVLPKVHLPPPGGTIFLRASHLLQYCKKQSGVISGAVFFKSRILVTQLNASITGRLLLIKPQQSHLPCIKIEPDYPCPQGVRLMKVYLSSEEYLQILPHTILVFEGNQTQPEKSTSQASEDSSGKIESVINKSSPESTFEHVDQVECEETNKEMPTNENCNEENKRLDLKSTVVNDIVNNIGELKKSDSGTNCQLLSISSAEGDAKLGGEIYPSVEIESSHTCNLERDDSSDDATSTRTNSSDASDRLHKIDGNIANGTLSDGEDQIKRRSNKSVLTMDKASMVKNIKLAAAKGTQSIKGKQRQDVILSQTVRYGMQDNSALIQTKVSQINNGLGGRMSHDEVVVRTFNEPMDNPMEKSKVNPIEKITNHVANSVIPKGSESDGDKRVTSDNTPHNKTAHSKDSKVPSEKRMNSDVRKKTLSHRKKSMKNERHEAVVDNSGLVELELYVQGSSDMVVVLLMEKGSSSERHHMMALWKAILSQMGELDLLIKQCLANDNKPSQTKKTSSYNYLVYDPFTHSLEGKISLSGSELRPISSQENDFCETAIMLHEEFSRQPSLTHVTLRKHSGAVFGHNNSVQQTYFQSRDPRPSLSSPSERDPGMNIEDRATRKLLHDQGIHLV